MESELDGLLRDLRKINTKEFSRYLNAILVSILVFGAFIIGSLHAPVLALTIVVMLWVSVIFAPLLLTSVGIEKLAEKGEDRLKPLRTEFLVMLTFVKVSILLYFGHVFLAIGFVISSVIVSLALRSAMAELKTTSQ